MGISTWVAYRYKGRYYRKFCSGDGYPSGIGRDWASDIPDDPALLKEYILKTIPTLLTFPWQSVDNSWMVPTTSVRWTYLIDFDNNVFTVNGVVHFRFDNMPPRQWAPGGQSDFASYFNDNVPIPPAYLTTVSYWDSPRFDVDDAQQLYSGFHPVNSPIVEWGAPTWDTLSVAQHLSSCLIRTQVTDHAQELGFAAFRSVQQALGVFTWQIACMAASSNMTCPPADAPPIKDIVYACASLNENLDRIPPEPISFYVESGEFQNRYFQFRGCVVVLVVRLDEPEYMMYEVGLLAERLSNREGGGVGIAISSWQMVAVAVDGQSVRHSPVLDLHDRKELQEGMLLLMHLLRPTTPGVLSKSPWCESPPSHSLSIVSPVLPEEIIQRIIHFTDNEAFSTLPQVSLQFRRICLAQPRVGNFTLLGKQPGSNAIFTVLSTTSPAPTLATLTRVQAINYSRPQDREPKLWKYYPKSAMGNGLQAGLARTFQYHQTGSGTLEKMRVPRRGECWGPARLTWPEIVAGTLPTMRIQLIEGLWDMLVVGSERAINFEKNLNAPPDPRYIGEPPFIGEWGQEERWERARGAWSYRLEYERPIYPC